MRILEILSINQDPYAKIIAKLVVGGVEEEGGVGEEEG